MTPLRVILRAVLSKWGMMPPAPVSPRLLVTGHYFRPNIWHVADGSLWAGFDGSESDVADLLIAATQPHEAQP
jgi:hypothetical protein